MKITNKYGLPSALERFEAKNSYSKGHAEFSITELIDAPQISRLQKQHEAEITEDISDLILALLGTSIHSILEHGSEIGDITERRFYTTVSDHVISGQVDRMELIGELGGAKQYRVEDYKTVKGTKLVIDPEGDQSWHNQLNGYAFLARENGYEVEGLSVLAIVRDWAHASVRRNREFPKHAIVRVPIPLWSYEKQRKYITQCVADHTSETVRPCTDLERWRGDKIFAVMEYKQDGGLKVKARKLFKSSVQAQTFINNENLKATIVTRDTVSTRCFGNYCRVAQFCEQYANE